MFSSTYQFNFRVFLIIIFENLKHFSIRRFLFTIIFILLFIILIFFTLLLRILDEFFFPNYRKQKITEPVFIISTPRSGTTLLHRLMAHDAERFTYFLLYHNFIPSVCFYKFIILLKRIDSKLGGTMKRFWDLIENKVFAGWKGIHTMGFEKSEEDEGMFALTMNSPSCGIFCPWTKSFSKLIIDDSSSASRKKILSDYYLSTLKRFVFAWGKNKTLLVKNVMSCSRINMILDKMPDAKIIVILRHPYETIPSITSMFSKPWKVIAPELPENSSEFRYWGALNIGYYQNMLQMSQSIEKKKILFIQYTDLVSDAEATIHSIYDYFGIEKSPAFLQALKTATVESKKFASGNRYSLEQYGYMKNEIDEQLADVFNAFNF